MNIASFNLLPTEKFYNNYFNMIQDDPGALNLSFNTLGYGSIYFMLNMGTLLVVILTYPLLIVLSYFLKLLKGISSLNTVVY
jgi:hypothetical protein